ncbi:MAG: hypothetical protein ACFFDW_17470 [Candidatus Thorarchaeota archaeon]
MRNNEKCVYCGAPAIKKVFFAGKKSETYCSSICACIVNRGTNLGGGIFFLLVGVVLLVGLLHLSKIYLVLLPAVIVFLIFVLVIIRYGIIGYNEAKKRNRNRNSQEKIITGRNT